MNIQIFSKACFFAARKHQNQRRKVGDIPYINHPLEVAYILSNSGIQDYATLSAAVLHDTIQDTQTSYEELIHQFGEEIAKIVLQCSDDKNLGKSQRKIIQIQKASKASPKAKLVKLADKISNNKGLLIEAPVSWSPQRVKGYMLWSQAVCKNLTGVNQNLDKQFFELVQKMNIKSISGQQKQNFLNQYYVQLDKSSQK